MRYFKLMASTLYVGTGNETYVALEDSPTVEREVEQLAQEFCFDNAQDYEYLVENEAYEEDDVSDLLDSYYEECDYSWIEVSETEYLENVG